MNSKKKILFFSHAVTMAHFTRPLRWIECLDKEIYDITIATNPDFKKYVPVDTGVKFIPLHCIDPQDFSVIVDQAQPIYDKETFESHVQEDLKVIDMVQPDLVVGDFRHSLSVSSRLCKVKYINITNAYWSPDIALKFPMPETSIVRTLGLKIASIVIAPFLKLALKINFFKMVFIVRDSLKSVGLSFTDYRQVITDGDVTIYCDSPSVVPLTKKTSHEHFIGPLLWSMPTKLPVWWGQLNPSKKKVFLSLGSSGNVDTLPLLIQSLAKLDVEVIVALAGKSVNLQGYANVHTTDFLPLDEVFEKVDLVICNGGSPMSHAALMHGLPTLGVVGNNDQLLNMAHLENIGVGRTLRYWNLSESKIIAAVNELLNNPLHRQAAEAVKSQFKAVNTEDTLRQVIADNV